VVQIRQLQREKDLFEELLALLLKLWLLLRDHPRQQLVL